MDQYEKLLNLLDNKQHIKLLFVTPDYSRNDKSYKYQQLDLSYFDKNMFTCDEVYILDSDIEKTIKLAKNYDCVVNQCDGYVGNTENHPNTNFIDELEKNNIPYTGSNARVFCLSKNDLSLIKNTPKTCRAEEYVEQIAYPLFVKPNNLGCSELVDMESVVYNKEQLNKQLEKVYKKTKDILLQEYLDGSEYTAVVFKNRKNEVICLGPVQILFINSEIKYFTEAIKASDDTEHMYNFDIPNRDELNKICIDVYKDLKLNSYVRMDMRNNYVIDVNPYCELLCTEEYEEMSDTCIVKYYNYNEFMIDILYDAGTQHQCNYA